MDEELIKRLYITLCVLSSNNEVDAKKLQEYNHETAKLYISLYNWYYMPQAVHNMLANSSQVINIKAIPVGFLSEEPQESSNKVFKFTREHLTRKFSRAQTNYNLMTRMLCSSDPKVSSKRRSQGKEKDITLPEEARYLMKECESQGEEEKD